MVSDSTSAINCSAGGWWNGLSGAKTSCESFSTARARVSSWLCWMAAIVRCLSFASSSAGKAGSRSCSASVATTPGKSRLSDCAETETVKVLPEKLTRAPTDSSDSAISSLPRRVVPLVSMSAVVRASPCLPGGLK